MKWLDGITDSMDMRLGEYMPAHIHAGKSRKVASLQSEREEMSMGWERIRKKGRKGGVEGRMPQPHIHF